MSKKSSKPKKRVFKTMESFDQAYFPSLLEKQKNEKLTEEPVGFGAKLAGEVLSDIRKALH
jgi:malate/lactate dehydrogenase